MTRHRFAVWFGAGVAATAVLLGLLTRNPNWPANLPLGLAIGYVVGGLVLWPVVQWLDRRHPGA